MTCDADKEKQRPVRSFFCWGRGGGGEGLRGRAVFRAFYLCGRSCLGVKVCGIALLSSVHQRLVPDAFRTVMAGETVSFSQIPSESKKQVRFASGVLQLMGSRPKELTFHMHRERSAMGRQKACKQQHPHEMSLSHLPPVV